MGDNRRPEKVAAIMARVAEAGKSAGLDFAYDKICLRANSLLGTMRQAMFQT